MLALPYNPFFSFLEIFEYDSHMLHAVIGGLNFVWSRELSFMRCLAIWLTTTVRSFNLKDWPSRQAWELGVCYLVRLVYTEICTSLTKLQLVGGGIGFQKLIEICVSWFRHVRLKKKKKKLLYEVLVVNQKKLFWSGVRRRGPPSESKHMRRDCKYKSPAYCRLIMVWWWSSYR